jgi:hypothetical protein
MVKKAILITAGLGAACALGFFIGFSVSKPARGDWSAQIFGAGLPGEFATQGGPLVEDLRARHFRLAIASFNEHLRVTGRRRLQGHFKLAVFDSAGKPVYVMENAEAHSDCRVDYSEFPERYVLKFVYYTWDLRQPRDVPWKVEILTFRPEGPVQSSVRFALPPEPGDTKRIAALAAQARKNFELGGKTTAGSAKSEQAYTLVERSLNQLRNIGMDKPDEVIKCFRTMKWADGAAREAVDEYLQELLEVQRVRRKPSS